MNLEELNMDLLLPHGRTFRLVDQLVSQEDPMTVCRLQVTESTPLVSNGMLQEAGLLESMAQTCAARMGYQTWLHKEKPKIGVIGQVRNLRIARLPHTGETLHTSVTILQEMGSLLLVEGTIHSNQELIASARLSLAVNID